MNSEALLKQYTNTGLKLPKYQFEKLSPSLKKSYLRSIKIALEDGGARVSKDFTYEMNYFSEEEQLKFITKRGKRIIYVDNPTPEMQLIAIKKYPETVRWFKNPPLVVQKLALIYGGDYIPYDYYADKTNNMTIDEIQMEAIKNSGHSFEFMNNPSELVCRMAVSKYPSAIKYIKNPSEELKELALNKDPEKIHLIKDPSEKLQMLAVSKRPDTIMSIQNPTPKVQIYAVSKNPNNIEYIKNPLPEVRLLAVKQNGSTLNKLDNQTEEEQLAAIENVWGAIRYLRNPSEKVKEVAYKILERKEAKETDKYSEVSQLIKKYRFILSSYD